KPGGGGGGPPTKPDTKISKGPKGKVKTKHKRAKVKFGFSSTTAGATFECAMTRAKSKKKAQKSAAPKFSACRSPKTYQLKPGKSTFSVRAVSSGGADPTPSTRKFSVVHVGG